MTPLAHRIVKELTLPVKQRTFLDQCSLHGDMDDIHCFDASAIVEVIGEQAQILRSVQQSERQCPLGSEIFFLPAPKTWIEMQFADGRREGVLLIEKELSGVRFAECYWAISNGEIFASAEKGGFLLLGGAASETFAQDAFPLPRVIEGESEAAALGWCFWLWAALAIINSPRMIGRKQHLPHRGLERRLANAKGLVGKFPLHAWTELKLSVSDIGKRDDGTEHEAHYTGEKCLHFCRAHLRIRNGKLERVSAHWRGNPALGIKRTRYRLAA